jgi:hypothetical protein
MKPGFEVASVLNAHWKEVACSGKYNSWQLRTMDALRRCRTASMGGHIDACSDCGYISISYNSCRNRHCPKCQTVQREKWIEAREQELIPVSYFHVVFTLPEELNRICMYAPEKIYPLLFSTAWSVMQSFSQDPKHLGADIGMISILHTWGQNLSLHPHLHCIVPGGGVTKAGFWKTARNKGEFLFPVKAMSKIFRARFAAGLRNLFPEENQSLYNKLFSKKWVVYAKLPFMGPKQVIEYLGRYTHKVAISNHRLINVNSDAVTFRYKDYRDGSANKVMTLGTDEFIRRFSLHILPKGLVRIRHYGILSSSRKKKELPEIHAQLNSRYQEVEKKDWKQISKECLGFNPDLCPCCKKETMRTVMQFDRRGPPVHLLEKAKSKQIKSA